MTTPTQEEVELTNSMRLHGEFHQTEQQPGSGTHRVNIHLLAEPPLPEAERENTLDHGYIKHASRSQRYKTRILWAIACSFFAVFYPLCIIIALTVTTPYNEGNCVTEFMSSDAFLAPDAAFGKMTVTQARAIDLTWNLVMGRLMPFVMALVSFEVTTLALMSVMEKQGVTYELFATVTLNAHSWLAVIPLSKAAIRSTAWRAKLTLAFMLYSAILILLMPTLMDIQTGYVRRQVPGVRFENGTIIEWQGCQGTGVVLCEIHGEIERVGLVCVDGEGYQWGWSVPWLYTTHVLTGIWSAGSYVLWFTNSRKSVLARRGRRTGPWRAAVDLGKAIEHDLGPDLDMISDKGLEAQLQKRPPIRYDIGYDGSGQPVTVALKASGLQVNNFVPPI